MTSLHAAPPAGEFITPLPMTREHLRSVPRSGGCYLVYVEGIPYYAGMSRKDMRARLRAHAAGRGSKSVREMIAQGKHLHFEYCAVDRSQYAHEVEDIERTESWFMLLHSGEPLPGNRKLDGIARVGAGGSWVHCEASSAPESERKRRGVAKALGRLRDLLGWLALFAAGISTACTSSSDTAAVAPMFRGMVYASTDSLRLEVGGTMLSLSQGYEIGIIAIEAASQRYLVLDSLIGRDDAGHPRWKVLDAVRLAVPDSFSIATGVCGRGKPWAVDSSIAAVVRDARTEFLENVSAAWRADLASHRFLVEPTKGLRCFNVPYED